MKYISTFFSIHPELVDQYVHSDVCVHDHCHDCVWQQHHVHGNGHVCAYACVCGHGHRFLYHHECSDVAFHVDVDACVCSHDDGDDDEIHEKVEGKDDGMVESLLFRYILHYLNDAWRSCLDHFLTALVFCLLSMVGCHGKMEYGHWSRGVLLVLDLVLVSCRILPHLEADINVF